MPLKLCNFSNKSHYFNKFSLISVYSHFLCNFVHYSLENFSLYSHIFSISPLCIFNLFSLYSHFAHKFFLRSLLSLYSLCLFYCSHFILTRKYFFISLEIIFTKFSLLYLILSMFFFVRFSLPSHFQQKKFNCCEKWRETVGFSFNF